MTSAKTESKDLKNLEKFYKKMNKSQDGVLTPEELKNGLSEIYGGLSMTSPEWTELIRKMDADGNEKIDYGEFILAATNRHKLMT